MRKKFYLLVVGLLLVLFSYSFAQIPQMINYQGKLTKSSGAPLDTTIQMIFSIYADSNGSVLKWTETQGAVKVEKGIFNVLLGSSNPIPDTVFDGTVRYLGVQVGADPEITQRKAIVSVGYAYRSAVADSVVGGGGGKDDGDWTIAGENMYSAVSGKVGIGTSSPAAKLEVSSVMRLTPSDSPGPCDETTKGSLYFNGSGNRPCYCNGTDWVRMDGNTNCECFPDNCPPVDSTPVCNNSSTCQGYHLEATCINDTCGITSVDDDRACDALVMVNDCGPYLSIYCNGQVNQSAPTCPTSCVSDAECDPNARCDGTCQLRLPNGSPCDENSDCLSGSCVGGYCQ